MRSSFVLNSVSSAQDINRSQLNTSKSKNLYSFSKDSRFKRPVVYCDSIYNIPSAIKKKGTGIGYGKKSDFTQDLTCSPGAMKYQLDTIFDNNRKSRKGFSMYVSRQKIPSRGYIPLEPLKVPAPNRYENTRPKTRSPSFTMRPKTRNIDKIMSIQPQNNNPGAGTYENPQSMSPNGKYNLAKYRGTGSSVFNPRRSLRFSHLKNTTPGPGKYQPVNLMSEKGHYPISSTLGYGTRAFDKEKRENKFQFQARKNSNPGPGSYRSPSDFGHYDGDVYKGSGAIAYMTQSTKLKSLSSSIRASKIKL